MGVPVIQPISSAVGRVRLVLFQPFDVGKWFILGFCAWLAHLGEEGVNFNFSAPSRDGRDGGLPEEIAGPFRAALEWGREHLALVIALGAAVLVLVIVISLVVCWVSSRGKFMFIDGIVRNCGAVVEPWHRLRELGNSLFWFRVLVGSAAVVAAAVVGGVGLAVGLRSGLLDGRGVGREDVLAILAVLAPPLVALVVLFLAVVAVALFLEDFVVPVMYLRGVRAWAAWGMFLREFLCAHFGSIVLFYLMKIVLALAAGLATLLVCCVTCCIALLPYIGTVILLPLFVFWRCYSLCFIEGFGGAWRVFGDTAVPGA